MAASPPTVGSSAGSRPPSTAARRSATANGTTTAGVARRAGVTQPLVHYHFATKNQLWREAVTTVLAGGVEKPSVALRVWTELMLWTVAIDRFRRRLGIGTREPSPGSRRSAA